MGKLYEAAHRADKFKVNLNQAAEGNWATPAGGEPEFSEDAPFDFVRQLIAGEPNPAKSRPELHVVPTQSRLAVAVPDVTLDLSRVSPHLAAFFGLDQEVIEQYKTLATTLISASLEAPLRRVHVTSVGYGEGRTTVALNLACALAEEGKRVLLVDADWQRPATLRLLGLDVERGLDEVVNLGLDAERAVVRVQPCGFDLLPLRRKLDTAAVLNSPVLPQMLDQLTAAYDFALFDAPPLGDLNGTKFVLRVTDAALLVVQPGKTTPRQMGEVIQPLTADRVFGVALNRIPQ